MQVQLPSSRTEMTDFMMFLRSGWMIVAACTLAGLAAAVLYLNVATYTYAVSFRVSPTENDSGNLAGNLGGLAAVAGISLGADRAVQPFELYVEAFYSPEVAEHISRQPKLMRMAFPDEWNPVTSQWQEPVSIVRTMGRAVKSALGIPVYPWQSPDSDRLQEYIEKEVILVRDPRKSVISFAMDHEKPEFAAALLVSIHEATDRMVRERALRRASSHIDYLSQKLMEITLAEHRAALAQTLGEQERIRMMSSSTMPYAADPLGAPLVSPRPTRPRPVIMLALGIFAGGFVGLLGAVVRGMYLAAHRRDMIMREQQHAASG